MSHFKYVGKKILTIEFGPPLPPPLPHPVALELSRGWTLLGTEGHATWLGLLFVMVSLHSSIECQSG